MAGRGRAGGDRLHNLAAGLWARNIAARGSRSLSRVVRQDAEHRVSLALYTVEWRAPARPAAAASTAQRRHARGGEPGRVAGQGGAPDRDGTVGAAGRV